MWGNLHRGFESLPLRQTSPVNRHQCARSSVDRALGCGPKGRGFESRRARQLLLKQPSWDPSASRARPLGLIACTCQYLRPIPRVRSMGVKQCDLAKQGGRAVHAADPVADQIGGGSTEPHPTMAAGRHDRAVRRCSWRAATFEGFLGSGPDTAATVAIVDPRSWAASSCPGSWPSSPRRILREAASLDLERTEMQQLYGQARRAALLDGLTGLGNHRAFQDELALQLEEAHRHGVPARAAAVRCRRAQGRQRRRRPRRRRPPPRRCRPDRGRDHASWRPRLPGGWRRIRGHPPELRRRDRPGGRAADARRGPRRRRPERADRAVLAVDRRERLPRPEHRDPRAVPPRRRGPVLVQAARSDRGRRLRRQPPRRRRRPSGRPPSWPPTSRRCSNRALRPVYQPIFSMETGLPVGFEGLVRPTDGAPFADAGSLFAAAEAAEPDGRARPPVPRRSSPPAPRQLPEDAYLSVNLSPRTLESSLFRASDVKGIFRRHAIALNRIVARADGTRDGRGPRRAPAQRQGAAIGRPAARRR